MGRISYPGSGYHISGSLDTLSGVPILGPICGTLHVPVGWHLWYLHIPHLQAPTVPAYGVCGVGHMCCIHTYHGYLLRMPYSMDPGYHIWSPYLESLSGVGIAGTCDLIPIWDTILGWYICTSWDTPYGVGIAIGYLGWVQTLG